ncbi:hypothetical protein [Actinokineospora sp. NPDC004072]
MSDVPFTFDEHLRAAAFGTAPDSPVPVVGEGSPDAWLAGVVLGARGFYAAAAAHLEPLIRSPHPVLAALAAATRASHLRQLGGHAAARPLDAYGLNRIAGADAPDAASDVLLGLAADAVGLGRVEEARRLVGRDTGAVGPRALVRRCWLRAEIELAAGNAAGAIAPAREALAIGFPSVRHGVKSAVVLAAALAAAGERDEAEELLIRNLQIAVRHGLRPLVWPAALVLTQLGHTDRKEQASVTLRCVLRHSDPIARACAEASPWVPTWLFSSAPNR